MSVALGHVLFAASVLLYGAASALFFVEVVRSTTSRDERGKLPLALLAGAALSHFGYVAIASFVARVCPVHSAHFILSMASLLATLVYFLARRRFRVRALGLVVAPLGLVVTLGTFFMGAARPASRLPASFIGLHVVSNLVGDALFLLAFGAAVMYLAQERRLKNKRSRKLSGLPALDSLDRAAHRFLIAGFPLATLGVATGTVWAGRLEAGSADEVLRAVFGYATWLLIGGVLVMRSWAGWRGRRAAYGTVAGFACAVVVLLVYLLRPLLKAGPALGG